MSVVHRVYARALFDAALDEGRLEQVSADLAQLAAAVAEVPELHELLRNPQLDPRAKAAALDDLLSGGEGLVRNFVLLLADKGRAGSLDEKDQRRLIDEAIGELDFSVLERND